MRISEFRWVQRPNAVEPRFLRHVFVIIIIIICDSLETLKALKHEN